MLSGGLCAFFLFFSQAPHMLSLEKYVKDYNFSFDFNKGDRGLVLSRLDRRIRIIYGVPWVIVDGKTVLPVKSAPFRDHAGKIFLPTELLRFSNMPHEMAQNNYQNIKPLDTSTNLKAEDGAFLILDPGHGGKDPGAVNGVLKVQEKDINAKIVAYIKAELETEAPSLSVYLTREVDETLSLNARVSKAVSIQKKHPHGFGLFLSIHANSSSNPEARGVETYYYNTFSAPSKEAREERENVFTNCWVSDLHVPSPFLDMILGQIGAVHTGEESQSLANHVQKSLIRNVSHYSISDRGVKSAALYVTGYVSMPSILVEVGFLSHEREGAYLRRVAYQKELASGIAHGVVQYLESRKTDIGKKAKSLFSSQQKN